MSQYCQRFNVTKTLEVRPAMTGFNGKSSAGMAKLNAANE
jgi:hypothetical protein